MDILGMLQNDFSDLCEEDLKMMQEELDLGDYSFEYKEQCNIFMRKATRYFETKKREEGYLGNTSISGLMVMNEDEIKASENEEASVSEDKSQYEIFYEKLCSIRTMPAPEQRFILLTEKNDYVTNAFIDQHFSVFNKAELQILLKQRQFSEDFLEKYFNELDKGTIVINQLFSEEFYMKHYDELPMKLVLTRSKNPWRDKSKRSPKLSTFLRIKGVKI